jgi:DNA-binding LacI/PurR family transcriptional regulator
MQEHDGENGTVTQRQRWTIREVAAAAGVSTQTVSRVLNNRVDVAPETLLRVQEVIRETGYAPNMLARGLTQGRSHVLGVVAYGLDYFGPSRSRGRHRAPGRRDGLCHFPDV